MTQSWWKKDLIVFSSLSRENSRFAQDTLLLQAVFILLSGMILDGGDLLKVVLLAALGWWIGFSFILIRRPKTQNPNDQLFLKLGFLALLPVCFCTLPLWGLLRG